MKYLDLAKMSKAAYPDHDGTWSEVHAISIVGPSWSAKLYEKNDTQCVVFQGAEDVVFAFRGTESDHLKDLKSDIDVRHKTIEGAGWVYQGFHDAMCQLKDELTALVDKIQGRHIWLTGHSLGGVEAIQFGDYLARSEYEIDGVVTFGSPRPGGAEFKGGYNARLGDITHRFMAYTDPVPLVPSWHRGGRQVGRHFHWWTGLGWRNKFNWLRALYIRFFVLRAIGVGLSHAIDNYVKILEKHEDEL